MRNVGLAAVTLTLTSHLYAQGPLPDHTETLLHEANHNVTIELNEQTVLCSEADYSALFLKILIPQLKDITLLDHRNPGAGAPCVAAGMCKSKFNPDGFLPSDVIRSEAPTENVTINVKLVRENFLDHVKKKCQTSLTESIALTVRGIPFTHTKFLGLGERHYEDCL